jgi:hypothetical protein
LRRALLPGEILFRLLRYGHADAFELGAAPEQHPPKPALAAQAQQVGEVLMPDKPGQDDDEASFRPQQAWLKTGRTGIGLPCGNPFDGVWSQSLREFFKLWAANVATYDQDNFLVSHG